MGVSKGCITDNMEKLKVVFNDFFNEDIDIADRFNEAMKIMGMGHGKVSMFLHIKNPKKYGVWNSCTDVAFKILSKTEDGKKFKIREANIG